MYQCTPRELAEQTGPFLFEMYQDLLCKAVERQAEKLRGG